MLSQFSRKIKQNEDSRSSYLEEVDADEDVQFAALEDVDDEGFVGDKDPVVDDDEDMIAPDVAASDQAMIDDILAEVELNGRLDPLSRQDSLVGCIAIAKVCQISF